MNLLAWWSYTKVLAGCYVGWGIGANDSANIFGTAVATGSVRYETAVRLIAAFALAGAVIGGAHLYDSLDFGHADGPVPTENEALVASLAGGTAILVVTVFGIPASTSQAAIGGLMGIAIFRLGLAGPDWSLLRKMFLCWVLTPIGAAVVAYALLLALAAAMSAFVRNVGRRTVIYRWGLLLFGCYGAYALGENNVVVTTVAFYQAGYFGEPTAGVTSADYIAAAVGGLSISVGALTYSRKVMETVGRKITALDPLSALVAVLAHSITLQVFSSLHVPVSSSQAIVGGVIGVGLVRGASGISGRQLARIFVGWIATPVTSCLVALGMAYLIV